MSKDEKDENLTGVKKASSNYSFISIGRWPVSFLIFFLVLAGVAVGQSIGQQQQTLDPTQEETPQVFPLSIPTVAPSVGVTSSGTPNNGDLTNPSANGLTETTQSLRQAQRVQQESLRNQQRILGLRGKSTLTEFQQMVAATTGRTLPIFGASIFSNALPSTFSPVSDVPVTPDYVIGPGDELRLQVWGQVNLRGTFVVDRTGAVALPGAGTIHVAGVRFDHLTDFLRSQLARVYRNFDLN